MGIDAVHTKYSTWDGAGRLPQVLQPGFFKEDFKEIFYM